MKHHYIAVMGTMGVGKSSVSKVLARELGWHLFEEEYKDNPFLAKFYSDMERYAFASQTTFLVEKLTQMQETKRLLTKTHVIQDTPVVQDVYSYALAQVELGHMSAEEWVLYERIYTLAIRDLPKPDLYVYLEADVETFLSRIASRGRDFEQKIDPDYVALLDRLNREWKEKNLQKNKILFVDTKKRNILHESLDCDWLVGKIKLLL